MLNIFLCHYNIFVSIYNREINFSFVFYSVINKPIYIIKMF